MKLIGALPLLLNLVILKLLPALVLTLPKFRLLAAALIVASLVHLMFSLPIAIALAHPFPKINN
ncbi:hypothetical protein EST38_g8568 [Candolleomyces aberdarensis]|uniref:Uncharacterized protein n=1 Tax=Candolleomyces aberdarensis TaxID=2316362 RepID=A0A4Q2DEG6_9AGAR|nr:hypothetical protein EST38_g8568 [Candolleomyces aberdarensis]